MSFNFAGIEALAAAVGIMIFAATGVFAYVLFRILRRSIRIAFRLALLAAILAVGAIGGVSFWWFNSGDAPAERPRPTRKR